MSGEADTLREALDEFVREYSAIDAPPERKRKAQALLDAAYPALDALVAALEEAERQRDEFQRLYEDADKALGEQLHEHVVCSRELDEARKWANTMEHERDWERDVVQSQLIAERDVVRDALREWTTWFEQRYPDGQTVVLPGAHLYGIYTRARAALAVSDEPPLAGGVAEGAPASAGADSRGTPAASGMGALLVDGKWKWEQSGTAGAVPGNGDAPEIAVLRSELMQALGRSKGCLEMVGDGDWTPQDSIHLKLVRAVEFYLLRLGTSAVSVDEPPSEPDGKPSVAHDPGHEKARAETAASGSLRGGTAGAVPGSGDETG